MLTITYSAKAEISFTYAELQSMHGPKVDLEIYDILLEKMKEQGYPYATLKDRATILQWNSINRAHWYVYASWTKEFWNTCVCEVENCGGGPLCDAPPDEEE